MMARTMREEVGRMAERSWPAKRGTKELQRIRLVITSGCMRDIARWRVSTGR